MMDRNRELHAALVVLDASASLLTRGGPGSGDFAHAGRPGEAGGSAPGGGGGEAPGNRTAPEGKLWHVYLRNSPRENWRLSLLEKNEGRARMLSDRWTEEAKTYFSKEGKPNKAPESKVLLLDEQQSGNLDSYPDNLRNAQMAVHEGIHRNNMAALEAKSLAVERAARKPKKEPGTMFAPGRLHPSQALSVFEAARVARGGPGSGNIGHAGRPGEVGGSAPGGGGGNGANRALKMHREGTPEGLRYGRAMAEARRVLQETGDKGKARAAFDNAVAEGAKEAPAPTGNKLAFEQGRREGRVGTVTSLPPGQEPHADIHDAKFKVNQQLDVFGLGNRVSARTESGRTVVTLHNWMAEDKTQAIRDVAKDHGYDVEFERPYWKPTGGPGRTRLAHATQRSIGVWSVPTLIARGGPGSGNIGHTGRPGEVGGSAPGGGGLRAIAAGHPTTPEGHGRKIAAQTLLMPKPIADVMGGPTQEEAAKQLGVKPAWNGDVTKLDDKSYEAWARDLAKSHTLKGLRNLQDVVSEQMAKGPHSEAEEGGSELAARHVLEQHAWQDVLGEAVGAKAFPKDSAGPIRMSTNLKDSIAYHVQKFGGK